MSLFEALRSAVVSLMANKSRSILTMLGVIIGVAAVMIVVAIGEGLKADTLERIRSMGANLITVIPGGGGRGWRATRPGRLTDEDVHALEANSRHISAIAPTVESSGVTVRYRNLTHRTQVTGTNASWDQVLAFSLSHGRFFSNGEVRARSRVAVIGSDVAEELFYGRPMVGHFIRLNGIPFEVIGILEEKGGRGSPDDQVVIPISSARQRLVGGADLSRIYLSAASEDVVPDAIESITTTLHRTHRVTEETEDFRIRDQTEFLQTMTETTGQMTLFVGGIALVSLLVGGIGIMNIMLVSVAERTREIGIRKAVGARRSDILAQFLIESIMLSVTGGLIGIGLGLLGSNMLGDTLGWETLVPMWSIMLSFLFAAAVGVFFGFYPARQAAKLDPIECLRYE